jgi:hypothetical protein
VCDCPTGKSLKPVQPLHKNIPLRARPKSPLQLRPSRAREEGRIAIVTDVERGERWPRRRRARKRLCRVSLLMSEGRAPTNGARPPSPRLRRTGTKPAEGFGARRRRGRQSRVVLAPVAGVKPAEMLRVQPDFANVFNPPATEARGIRLRGERGISRKPTAQGMPGCSGCTCMLVCVH